MRNLQVAYTLRYASGVETLSYFASDAEAEVYGSKIPGFVEAVRRPGKPRPSKSRPPEFRIPMLGGVQ